MKSYNEAYKNAKLSLGYSVSRGGLLALRSIILSSVTKLKPRRVSLVNFQTNKAPNAIEQVEAYHYFCELLNSINDLLKSFNLGTVLDESRNDSFNVSNSRNSFDSSAPSSPHKQRVASLANKEFLKQNSYSLSKANIKNLMYEEFELSVPVEDDSSYANIGCVQCIIA